MLNIYISIHGRDINLLSGSYEGRYDDRLFKTFAGKSQTLVNYDSLTKMKRREKTGGEKKRLNIAWIRNQAFMTSFFQLVTLDKQEISDCSQRWSAGTAELLHPGT